MDPRVSWYQPELITKAYDLWNQIWMITQMDTIQKANVKTPTTITTSSTSTNGSNSSSSSTSGGANQNLTSSSTSNLANYQSSKQQEDNCFLKYIENTINKDKNNNNNNSNSSASLKHVNSSSQNIDSMWRTVKHNKASTYGFNLPHNDYLFLNYNQSITIPWLNFKENNFYNNYFLINDRIKLINLDSEDDDDDELDNEDDDDDDDSSNDEDYLRYYNANKTKCLLTLDPLIPIIKLDKGFLR